MQLVDAAGLRKCVKRTAIRTFIHNMLPANIQALISLNIQLPAGGNCCILLRMLLGLTPSLGYESAVDIQ